MNTELLNAVQAGDKAKTESLLKGGADINTRNEEGATPLMIAAGNGNDEMVELLLKSGAEVDAVDIRGWTALMKAIFNYEQNKGFPDIVQTLIDAGADIEHTIVYGTRPLMLAAGYGEARVVEVLLAAGVDVSAQNEGGRTARIMAETKDYVEVVNLLHMHDINSMEGKSPCSVAPKPGAPGGVSVINFMRKPQS